MVSTLAMASQSQPLEGLTEAECERVIEALKFVTPIYAAKQVVTEQNALQFVEGVVSTLAMLRTDVDTRVAGLLFELPDLAPVAAEQIEAKFGKEIADFV